MRFQKFAPFILRLGLAIVFLLFGLKKLADPGQATSEIQLLLNFELADAAALNYYLGIIEMIIAIGFIIGLRVRLLSIVAIFLLTSFLLSFFIKFGVSINPDLYRDIGLIAAALSLLLLAPGPFSLDQKLAQRKEKQNNE